MNIKIKEVEQVIKNSKLKQLKQKFDGYEKKTSCLQKGQYSNKVRTAYQVLICDCGVTRNNM